VKLLDDFSPYVVPYAPGVTTPMFEQALLSTAYDFCNQTDIVQEVVATGVSDGVGEYYIEVPNEMLLGRVLGVFYGELPLKLVALTHVDIPFALRGAVDGVDPPTNTPTVAYQREPGAATIWLYPLPDRTDETLLTVRASFCPARNATQVPDVLFDNWVETIAAGAIAELMSIPGQPFSNPAAPQYRARYLSGVASARSEARKGRTLSSIRVRPRNFSMR
jgi:hypothetical protein